MWSTAIFGVRKGQAGIFYPPIDIELLAFDRRSENQVVDDMLSEALIIK